MAVNSILRAFAPAAKVTLPVGTGYLFLGAAYGIYMHVNGFSVWYPALMAWLIYGGSLEFVAASMLLSPFAPVTTFFVAFMIQARHLFTASRCWIASRGSAGRSSISSTG